MDNENLEGIVDYPPPQQETLISTACSNYFNKIEKGEFLKQFSKYSKYLFGIATPIFYALGEYPTAGLFGVIALYSTYRHSKQMIDEKIAEIYLDEYRHNQQMAALNGIYAKLQEQKKIRIE